MFLQKFSARFFHCGRLSFCAASAGGSAQKSALAALRKKTGYTFANCKKALAMHNYDMQAAETWLNQEAQTMGWSKATKLADRATAQGLVGVLIRGNTGAMVEVNCETDFVARNENFRNFVDQASRICAKYTEMTEFDGDLWKLGFESEALKNLKTDDGRTLGDHLALLIGTVGENASIRRAICFKVKHELKLAGYAHPAPNINMSMQNTTQLGKYGAIVALRSYANHDESLLKNLCQHIVGMNPQNIGEEGKSEPMANKDDETTLIHQEYLLDADKTFGEVLKENHILVVDYQRFECGISSKNDELEQLKLSN